MNSRAFFWFKVFGSCALLCVIVWAADWAAVGNALRESDARLLLVVFALMTLCVTYSAYKWWLLLNLHDAPFDFSRLHRWYFIAMFFNNFLPTSIGGDGFRVYRTLDNVRTKSTAVVAVLMERLTGIVSLLGVGFLAAIVGFNLNGNKLSATVMWLGFIGLGGLVLVCAVCRWTGWHRQLLSWSRMPRQIHNVLQHFSDYSEKPTASIWVMIVSVLFHLVSIAWMYLLTRAIGGQISIIDLTIVAALVSVVTILPLSINGIGLVDGSFIFLASQYGLDVSLGLTFMILQRALLVPISIVGALLYLAEKEKDRTAKDNL